jgi:hypothetical protein
MKRDISLPTAPRRERSVKPVLKESVEVDVVVVVIVAVSPVNLASLDPLWPALTAVRKVTDLPTAQTRKLRALLTVVPLRAVVVVVTVTAIDSMARHARMLTLWIELTELAVDAVVTARLVPAVEAGVVKEVPLYRVRRKLRGPREPTVHLLRRKRELPARDVSALFRLKMKRKLASPSTTTSRRSRPSQPSSAKPRK